MNHRNDPEEPNSQKDGEVVLAHAKAELALQLLREREGWEAATRAEAESIESAAASYAASLSSGTPRAAAALPAPAGWRRLLPRLAATDRYYQKLQAVIGRGPPCIDEVEQRVLRPGYPVDIRGTSFGSERGRVPFSLSPGDYARDLTVHSWSENHIVAEVPADISGVGVKLAQLGVIKPNGDGAMGISLLFEPLYDCYLMTKTKSFSGGAVSGRRYDGIVLDGHLLDPEFSIFHVSESHSGKGWAELREPSAGARSLAQGYHVYAAPWRTITVDFQYQIRGPRGMDANTPEPLVYIGPWIY